MDDQLSEALSVWEGMSDEERDEILEILRAMVSSDEEARAGHLARLLSWSPISERRIDCSKSTEIEKEVANG